MKIAYTLCHHLANLIPFRSIRHKIKKTFLWRHYHLEVVNYLDDNYVSPFLNGVLPHYQFKPLKNFKDKKIIWQLWFQGYDNAPKLVKCCFDSVQKQMGTDYTIVILDEKNVSEYIALPPFVWDKLANDTFSKAFFSDLLRICLLATYGGVWLDATIYLSGQIPTNLLSQDFFAFQRSIISPQNYKIWQSFNDSYFVWDKDFKVRFLSSFISAKANHPIIIALQDILLAYWQNEQKLKNYFAFQIIFELLIQNENYSKLNCTITNDTDIHLLQFHAKEPFDETLWKDIQRITPLHKLTYFKDLDENSMAERILNLKEDNER